MLPHDTNKPDSIPAARTDKALNKPLPSCPSRTGWASIHTKALSACLEFQAPREGRAPVLTSPQSQGYSFKDPAKQINKATLLPGLCSPYQLFAWLLSFLFQHTETNCASSVSFYPLIRCSYTHFRQQLCSAFCLGSGTRSNWTQGFKHPRQESCSWFTCQS